MSGLQDANKNAFTKCGVQHYLQTVIRTQLGKLERAMGQFCGPSPPTHPAHSASPTPDATPSPLLSTVLFKPCLLRLLCCPGWCPILTESSSPMAVVHGPDCHTPVKTSHYLSNQCISQHIPRRSREIWQQQQLNTCNKNNKMQVRNCLETTVEKIQSRKWSLMYVLKWMKDKRKENVPVVV